VVRPSWLWLSGALFRQDIDHHIGAD